MQVTITAFERKVLETTFKWDVCEGLIVASKLPALLRSPSAFNFKNHSCVYGNLSILQCADKLPTVIRNVVNNDSQRLRDLLTGIDQKAIAFNFEGILEYEFDKLFREGYKFHLYAKEFAEYDQLPLEKIERLCRSAELLKFIFNHYKNPLKLNIIYSKLKPYLHLTVLRLTTVESTRRLISRKEQEGLPNCLIHKGIGKLSNNHKLSEFMQNVIISLATSTFVRKSSPLIKGELDFLIDRLGKDRADALGIYNLSTSKISSFLNGPIGSRRIAEALAEPLEFKRKVLGHFDFLRASAPLVKVSVDAYVIQIKYFDDEEDQLSEYVAIHFHDDLSDFVISTSLDSSENGESFLRALRDYLEFTKGALPRCIYVDGYTYRLIQKYSHVLEFLVKRGVIVQPSGNPNSKSSLERFFLTIQQKQLPKSIHYLGPGIKSRKPLSHPNKYFRMILNHKKNALADWELARLYKYFVQSGHNNGYFGRDGYSPIGRFEKIAPDPACIVDTSRYIPHLCYKLHKVTVVGGAIKVPLKKLVENKSESDSTRNRNITTDKYENRTDEFNDQVHEQLVDARIDSENPLEAHVYFKGTTDKVGVMKLVERLPNNEYDRTEGQHKQVDARNAESARIENGLAQKRISGRKQVNDSLGFDIWEVTEEGRASNELKQQSKSSNIGLDEFDDDKKLFNPRLTRRKRKHKYGDDDYLESISDTF